MFRTLIRALRRSFVTRRRPTPRQPRVPLYLEPLGERVVPATFNWTGQGGDLLWSNPDNWSTGGVPGVPGAADRVQFFTPSSSEVDALFGGTVNELIMSNVGQQHALHLTGSLTVTSTLDVANAHLLIQAGQVLGAHQATVIQTTIDSEGTFAVTGTALNPGSMSISFSTIAGIQTTLSVGTNTTVSLGQSTLISSHLFNTGRTVVMDSSVSFAGATVFNSGTFEQLVHLTFQNTAFTNSGTYEWDGGNLELSNGTVFDNQGTVAVTCDQTMNGSGQFENRGVFKKIAGVGTLRIAPATFKSENPVGGSTASVEVWAGQLWLDSTGLVEGNFTAGAIGGVAAVLDFSGGEWELTGGMTFLGQGIIRITQGEVDGTLAGMSLTNNGTLEVAQGIGQGILSNVALLSNGILRWYGGHLKSVNGSVNTLEIDEGTEQIVEESTLTLFGDTTWKGGIDVLLKNSTIHNRGTFDIQNDRTILEGNMAEPSRFINEAGLVKKTNGAGAGQTRIDVFFEQAGGDLDLNGFKVNFAGGIEQTDVGSDTRLNGGTLVVAATFLVRAGLVSGFGTVQGDLKIDGGTVDLTGPTGFGILQVTGKYEQTATSTLKVKVGNNGQQDKVSAGGKAILAGTLQVTKKPGSTIIPGNTYTIIESATERGGSFGSVTGDGTWTQNTTNNKKLTLEAQ